jgi:hypothetical protein
MSSKPTSPIDTYVVTANRYIIYRAEDNQNLYYSHDSVLNHIKIIQEKLEDWKITLKELHLLDLTGFLSIKMALTSIQRVNLSIFSC